MAAHFTVTITMVPKPLWKQLLSFPRVCKANYTAMRRESGSRIVAIYTAWRFAGLEPTMTTGAVEGWTAR